MYVLSHILLFVIPWTVVHSSAHGIFQARMLECVVLLPCLEFYDVLIPHFPPVLSQFAFPLSRFCCLYIPHILLALVKLPIQTHTHTHTMKFSEISCMSKD